MKKTIISTEGEWKARALKAEQDVEGLSMELACSKGDCVVMEREISRLEKECKNLTMNVESIAEDMRRLTKEDESDMRKVCHIVLKASAEVLRVTAKNAGYDANEEEDGA